MTLYHALLVPKFIGVLLYGGAFVAALLAPDEAHRKVAVHRVGGVGLALIWLFGFAALEATHQPMTELWVVGALIASFIAQGVLGATVKRPKPALFASAGMLILAAIVCMVVRPRMPS